MGAAHHDPPGSPHLRRPRKLVATWHALWDTMVLSGLKTLLETGEPLSQPPYL